DFPQKGAIVPWLAMWPRAEYSDFQRSRDVRLFFRRQFRGPWPSRHLVFVYAVAGFEQSQDPRDLKQSERSPIEPLQAKCNPTMASDFKSFDQGREPRRFDVGNAG